MIDLERAMMFTDALTQPFRVGDDDADRELHDAAERLKFAHKTILGKRYHVVLIERVDQPDLFQG